MQSLFPIRATGVDICFQKKGKYVLVEVKECESPKAKFVLDEKDMMAQYFLFYLHEAKTFVLCRRTALPRVMKKTTFSYAKVRQNALLITQSPEEIQKAVYSL
jgi:hypothetical protein